MKKSKTEDQIVELIKIRQLELLTEATKGAIKAMENPPKTFAKSMKFAGQSLGIMLRVAQLQRAKNIIKPKLEIPKPEPVKGTPINHITESILMNNGNTIELDLKSGKCSHIPYGKIKGVGYEKLHIKNPINELLTPDYLMTLHPDLTLDAAYSLLEYCQKNTIKHKICYGNGSIMYQLWKNTLDNREK